MYELRKFFQLSSFRIFKNQNLYFLKLPIGLLMTKKLICKHESIVIPNTPCTGIEYNIIFSVDPFQLKKNDFKPYSKFMYCIILWKFFSRINKIKTNKSIIILFACFLISTEICL